MTSFTFRAIPLISGKNKPSLTYLVGHCEDKCCLKVLSKYYYYMFSGTENNIFNTKKEKVNQEIPF